MNITEILLVVGITTFVVAPISFLVSAFIFSVGVRNHEEESYRYGHEYGYKCGYERGYDIGYGDGYKDGKESES